MALQSDTRSYSSALSSSTTPGAACIILQKALRCPSIFFYGSLLRRAESLPFSGSSAEYDRCLEILRLLAYGSVSSLSSISTAASGQMDAALLSKLQQLSILSLCKPYSVVSYDVLLTAIQRSSVHELEDVLLDAMSNGLLSGKLDHRARCIHCHHVEARDLADIAAAVPQLRSLLSSWKAQCLQSIQSLDGVAKAKEEHDALAVASRVELDAAKRDAMLRAKEMCAEEGGEGRTAMQTGARRHGLLGQKRFIGRD